MGVQLPLPAPNLLCLVVSGSGVSFSTPYIPLSWGLLRTEIWMQSELSQIGSGQLRFQKGLFTAGDRHHNHGAPKPGNGGNRRPPRDSTHASHEIGGEQSRTYALDAYGGKSHRTRKLLNASARSKVSKSSLVSAQSQQHYA